MDKSGNDSVLLAVDDVAALYPLARALPGSSEVWGHLRSASLTTANLKPPLSTGGFSVDKAITFLCAGPEVVATSRDAGIGLVSVVNNPRSSMMPTALRAARRWRHRRRWAEIDPR